MSGMSKDSPIRVCFVSPKSYPLFDSGVESVFGGAEVDLYLLGTELAKDERFEVSFIVADYGQGDSIAIDGVRVIKSLDFDKSAVSGAMRIWRAMRLADADLYMLKTASPGVPLAAAFCRLHHKALVYRTAHQYECDGTYLKEHFFLGKAFAASLRRAAAIFAQNAEHSKMLTETIGVDSVVIPNGHRLPVAGQVEREGILWVGRSADFKQPDKFIALAKQLPAEKFIMVCSQATGDENYDRLCRQVENVSNIEFHQRVRFDETDAFFQRAKVLVNTSDAEGFANTFIQACKCATAILSLNVNPDGFLDEYSCGICCNGGMERLAEGLRFMLEKNRYVELGSNGRKYVEEHHDIAKIVEQYKHIFAQLAQKSN
jgi:glycosyltransferase involved in cell wall biosynthesis